jgi:hypothetical protein
MSILKGLSFAIVLSLLLAACNNNVKQETASTTDTTMKEKPLGPITLTDVDKSPEFPDAKLTIAQVMAEKMLKDSAKVTFNFSIKNYELMQQTDDASDKSCNNSDKGQHIHFILDNKPYVALYEPKYEVVLPLKSEHTLLVFLSRSYHESLKNKTAAYVYHFKIDENGKVKNLGEQKTPMIFYSRPKGDYAGEHNTANILLDFYLRNVELSADGYKVKVKLNTPKKDSTFTLTEWKSHFLKNIPMGKSSITLTLIDKAGKKVNGPFTEVTREFNLTKGEPTKK